MVQAVIPTTVVGLQGRSVAATPAPTNNQALIWNGTAWVPGGPYLTAAGAPYIATNYIDNSGFTVNQRAYTSGTALAPGAYGFDRWKAGASGCTLTFTPSPASTVVTITAGTLQQVIEGQSQINSTYTLSWTGSATGRINTGSYVASPISFTGAPNTAVTIEFQGGTLGQVQLQIGSQATLWQPLAVAVEMERCQRFYTVIASLLFGTTLSPGVTVFFFGSASLPTLMRAAPTVTLANLSSNGNVLTSSITLNTTRSSLVSLSAQTNVAGNGNGWAAADLLCSADL